MKKRKSNGFLKGAATIAAGGFLAKVIGAFYRIPLTNLIGGHGIGLYQLVYPVYCLLLTVSATGIPSSIAKLTAERVGKGENGNNVLKTSMRLFLIIGGVGAVLMCVIAPFLSAAQNSKEITSGYFALAPSVFLVSAISVFRGWFQGKNQMFPTAASEVTEQLVKVGFGLFFAYRYRGNVEKAVVFLLLAVTLSEAVALLLIWWLYRRNKNKQKQGKDGGRVETKQVLKLSIPVTLSAILLPLSNLLDSVLVVRLLGVYAPDPVALYGLFSGGAVTVINLPVSVCYGIAAASIPAVAAVNSGKRKKIFFALGITVLLAAPAAVGLYVFARPLSQFIFRSLKGNELDTLVKLIRIFSISALTLSCTQTLSACLTAQGKPQYAALSMLVSVVVKTGVYTFLLQDAKMSVFGVAHAGNICYLVAFLLDLWYNLWVSKSARRKQT